MDKEKIREHNKKYREENREKIREYNKKYREKHPERMRERHRKYREENREKIREHNKKYREENREKFRKYREENKEKVKEYNKKYREENREKIRERKKRYRKENICRVRAKERKYREENPDKVKESRKKHYNKRRRNINYRLNDTISSNIYRCLKTGKTGKNGYHWEDLVGYTFQDLKSHLESQFEDWMDWHNYGCYSSKIKRWQIDHIKPISSFIFESYDDQEFKNCWALSNLRPLCAFENIKKGNKIITENEKGE